MRYLLCRHGVFSDIEDEDINMVYIRLRIRISRLCKSGCKLQDDALVYRHVKPSSLLAGESRQQSSQTYKGFYDSFHLSLILPLLL